MDYQVNQCLNYYSTLAGYYGYDLDGLVQNLLGYENTDAMLAHLESNLEDYSKEALLYQAVAESLDITPRRSSWMPTPIIRTPTARTTAPWWP